MFPMTRMSIIDKDCLFILSSAASRPKRKSISCNNKAAFPGILKFKRASIASKIHLHLISSSGKIKDQIYFLGLS
jgi:hypothetical protein